MRVAMIGSGYVGLVSSACFADFGHEVVCVDRDTARVAALRRGRIPIYEPGLEELVARNAEAGRLSFETELRPAVAPADTVFIAVGTPSRRGDGHADLTYVYAAAREIVRAAAGFTVVVTKSTVPVGTGDAIEAIAAAERPGADIAVVSNPEFLREGVGDRGLQAPRPHRGGRRGGARGGSDGRALPAALAQRRADPDDAPAHGRADQIRLERLPRDQDHLHQRDGRPLRKHRRRRAGGRPRHGDGQAHWAEVPARGPGIRRLLFPEGQPGAGAHRAGPWRLRCASSRPSSP